MVSSFKLLVFTEREIPTNLGCNDLKTYIFSGVSAPSVHLTNTPSPSKLTFFLKTYFLCREIKCISEGPMLICKSSFRHCAKMSLYWEHFYLYDLCQLIRFYQWYRGLINKWYINLGSLVHYLVHSFFVFRIQIN